MKRPNLKEEKKLWKKGLKVVAGLDEVGRGCLAGPVVAVATVIDPRTNFKKWKSLLQKVNDSKKLTPEKREKVFEMIQSAPFLFWAVGRVSPKVIDKINILEATKLAMKKAIKNLKAKINSDVDFLILDGNFKLNTKIPQKSIIKADEKVFSCAISSIIAKVKRDELMKKYAKIYPQFCFEKHKGYPTSLHLKMVQKYGVCKIHRKSFGPIKKYVAKNNFFC